VRLSSRASTLRFPRGEREQAPGGKAAGARAKTCRPGGYVLSETAGAKGFFKPAA
jgi:hypothetical protein